MQFDVHLNDARFAEHQICTGGIQPSGHAVFATLPLVTPRPGNWHPFTLPKPEKGRLFAAKYIETRFSEPDSTIVRQGQAPVKKRSQG
jgi:hypothetical protein